METEQEPVGLLDTNTPNSVFVLYSRAFFIQREGSQFDNLEGYRSASGDTPPAYS